MGYPHPMRLDGELPTASLNLICSEKWLDFVFIDTHEPSFGHRLYILEERTKRIDFKRVKRWSKKLWFKNVFFSSRWLSESRFWTQRLKSRFLFYSAIVFHATQTEFVSHKYSPCGKISSLEMMWPRKYRLFKRCRKSHQMAPAQTLPHPIWMWVPH